MTEHSSGVVILITLLNILVYKLQKLQEAQQKKRLPLSIRQLCRRFSLQDIKSATNNFKEELVIGKGGFGIVYRGIIDFKERIVAIKRAKAMSKQGSKEFLTEIKMLSQFQHSHLVSLVGYCDDYEEMILVYDHMPSGTLADHLHKRVRKGATSFPSLSWVQRLKICIGAAHGLDYLHTGTGIEDRVIHRDVKTTNILLDENLAAKISDFGLSKTGPANQTCTYVSTRVKGTPGYLDPYYVATHRLTRKTDVYAFGVVLFEVLCGRPAVDTSLPEEQISLAGWAQHCYEEGLLEQIIDPHIKAEISPDSLNMYVDMAIKCLHSQPKLRPTMAEVLVVLESALALQEKSTYYSLVEIIPSEYNSEEDVDSSTLDIKKTYNNREHESAGEAIVNISNDWHHNKQYSARMPFTKRVSVLLSVTAQALSGNRDAKTSRYRTGILSVNRNKLQGTNTRTFLPVYPAVPPQPRGEKKYLQSLKLYSFKFNDLKKATSKFRPDSVIGEGGFGCVYKGWIDENTFAAAKWGTGLAIAVKRLKVKGFQGHREWSAEINSLGTLTHPNLVKLIGYCLDDEHRLLVYEFMPQGTLGQHLFSSSENNQLVLDWRTRFKICIGIARGLAFLHEESRLKIVHRDIKATNVLLDRDLNPKISDFGLAKLNEEDKSHISTRVAGTIGYMAPEYAMRGYLTSKADVYSFGVVALEIISGKSNYNELPNQSGTYLLDWAWNLQKSKKFEELVDESLGSKVDNEEAVRMVKVALLCTNTRPSIRPIMSEVVGMLEGQLLIPDTTPET